MAINNVHETYELPGYSQLDALIYPTVQYVSYHLKKVLEDKKTEHSALFWENFQKYIKGHGNVLT